MPTAPPPIKPRPEPRTILPTTYPAIAPTSKWRVRQKCTRCPPVKLVARPKRPSLIPLESGRSISRNRSASESSLRRPTVADRRHIGGGWRAIRTALTLEQLHNGRMRRIGGVSRLSQHRRDRQRGETDAEFQPDRHRFVSDGGADSDQPVSYPQALK